MGGGRNSAAMLLAIPEVQKELGLTDDQNTKIKAAGDEVRQQFQQQGGQNGFQNFGNMSQDERAKAMADRQARFEKIAKTLDDKFSTILTPEQSTRLKQLQLQSEGATPSPRPMSIRSSRLPTTRRPRSRRSSTTLVRSADRDSAAISIPTRPTQSAKLPPRRGATRVRRSSRTPWRSSMTTNSCSGARCRARSSSSPTIWALADVAGKAVAADAAIAAAAATAAVEMAAAPHPAPGISASFKRSPSNLCEPCATCRCARLVAHGTSPICLTRHSNGSKIGKVEGLFYLIRF